MRKKRETKTFMLSFYHCSVNIYILVLSKLKMSNLMFSLWTHISLVKNITNKILKSWHDTILLTYWPCFIKLIQKFISKGGQLFIFTVFIFLLRNSDALYKSCTDINCGNNDYILRIYRWFIEKKTNYISKRDFADCFHFSKLLRERDEKAWTCFSLYKYIFLDILKSSFLNFLPF